jgi:hypothetical protein
MMLSVLLVYFDGVKGADWRKCHVRKQILLFPITEWTFQAHMLQQGAETAALGER